MKILLPADFLEEHRQIVLEYIRRGHEFKREDWRLAIVAFDLLKDAAVSSPTPFGLRLAPTGLLPFPVVYRQQVEARIDGETLFVLLSEIADTLSQAVRIIHQGIELTVIDYEIWKEKVQRHQTRKENNNEQVSN